MVLESIVLALGISSMVAYETTGKGLADHTISAVKSKDCKMARTLKGDDICQPQSTVTVSAAPKEPVPPVNPENPPPKRIVVVQSTVDRAEDVFAQRRAMK
jgi:hypothetical protein